MQYGDDRLQSYQYSQCTPSLCKDSLTSEDHPVWLQLLHLIMFYTQQELYRDTYGKYTLNNTKQN